MKKFIHILILSINLIHSSYSNAVFEEGQYAVYGKLLSYERYFDSNIYTKKPTIIVLHGGAFQRILGDKKYMRKLCLDFFHKGYQVFNIDYLQREFYLNPTLAYVESSESLQSFLEFLTKDHINLQVDTANLFLLGHSAGAITCLGYCNQDYSEINELQLNSIGIQALMKNKISIRGVISLAGGWTRLEDLANSNTPLFLIHSKEDLIIPYGSGIAFSEFGAAYNSLLDIPIQNIQEQSAYMGLSLGIQEHLQHSMEELTSQFKIPNIYGSEAIYNSLSDKLVQHSKLVTIPGTGHHLKSLYNPQVAEQIHTWIQINMKEEGFLDKILSKMNKKNLVKVSMGATLLLILLILLKKVLW